MQQASSSTTTTTVPPTTKNGIRSGPTQMGDGVTRRLQQELTNLMFSGEKNKYVSAFPDGDNLFKWIGTIRGAENTVYENLTYKLDIRFPAEYPFAPPTVTFITPCYHPNVDLATGIICLDILKDKWSASLSISSVLQSLCSLLGDPNNESPLNGQAACLWSNSVNFRKEVMKCHAGSSSVKQQ